MALNRRALLILEFLRSPHGIALIIVAIIFIPLIVVSFVITNKMAQEEKDDPTKVLWISWIPSLLFLLMSCCSIGIICHRRNPFTVQGVEDARAEALSILV